MSLKIEYGILEQGICDVTDLCLNSAKDGIIVIPKGDYYRCEFFGWLDPADGYLKKIYISFNGNNYEFNVNYDITINTITNVISWEPNDDDTK